MIVRMRAPMNAAWLVRFFLCACAIVASGPGLRAQGAGAPPSPTLEFPPPLDGLLGESDDSRHVTFQAKYELLKDGDSGIVSLMAVIDPTWHVYSLTQAPGGPTKSTIRIESDRVESTGPFVPDDPPHAKQDEIFGMVVEEHAGQVVWTAPIRWKGGADPAASTIRLVYDGQICKDMGSCILLPDVAIDAVFGGYVESLPNLGSASESATGSPAAGAAPVPRKAVSPGLLLAYVGLGFLGGIILNLMPCVLPVVGLKILSFAEQAHMRRGRVFWLNVWFSLGLVSVFLVLATLAAAFNMSWGEQFTHTWFKVAMIVLVFVMALSFLGVWEIPMPSFLGRGAANDLQDREGASGAFFKGVFTTLLSTPCSGPALGPTFSFLLSQPAYVTYLLFLSIGLGMASPYLVIGAFPKLIRFLPRPGMWMETFKEVMGFVMLATVVFLFTTISARWFVPTWTLLVGVWFACWLVGRVPITAEGPVKFRAWIGAATASIAVGLLGFTVLAPHDLTASDGETAKSAHQLPWKPFTPAMLEQNLSAGKTVLVDFTAQWCLTCKYNLYWTINTREVKELVERNGVVPLLADWTDRNDEIKRALAKLQSNSIPVLAIYPAGRPAEVMVMRDVIRKESLLDALRKAGPSPGVDGRGSEENDATAMATGGTGGGAR